MTDSIEIQIYETDSGKCPYLQWEGKLSRFARTTITSRLARVRLGLLGGDKGSQKKDIAKAYEYWQDHLNSNKDT